MRASTKARREADVLALALYLDSVGALGGISRISDRPATMAVIEDEMGWSEGRLRATLEYASDTPDIGIAFHVKRGRSRMVVLTYDGAATPAHPHVTMMVAGESHENIKRFTRSAVKAFVRLKKSQRSLEKRDLAWQARLQEKILRDVLFSIETHDEKAFQAEIAAIEAALAVS